MNLRVQKTGTVLCCYSVVNEVWGEVGAYIGVNNMAVLFTWSLSKS